MGPSGPHPLVSQFFWIPELIVNLQSELNFAGKITLTGNVSEGTGPEAVGKTASNNGAVLVPALIEAKNRTVKDVQEVRPKFDIHSLRNVGAFDDGNVFTEEGELA